MGTKLYNALQLIKLWDHAHYGDHITSILEPVMAKPISAQSFLPYPPIFPLLMW